MQFVETGNWALLGGQKNPSVVIEDFFEITGFEEKKNSSVFWSFFNTENSSVKKYLVSPIILTQ